MSVRQKKSMSSARRQPGQATVQGEGRPKMLRAALARAGVVPEEALFLGDTPTDVSGSRGCVARGRVVAIATGRTPANEPGRADVVLDSLSDTERAVGVIGT
ncbi:HAD family hydrolase [Streptomyces scopuliridis]|uniref:HAD hydrolase-like protein n=2 Tax=Streptomyces scopuliridis TaxID=452529 RepID=A0ACD4ZMK0_9ACTN|nr:HAD hydrolase-like protein [Streptomyces scopuliridis]WSB99550.1 HAD hydrolase-like protein [Streptomyces scopuliridis]